MEVAPRTTMDMDFRNGFDVYYIDDTDVEEAFLNILTFVMPGGGAKAWRQLFPLEKKE